MMETQLTALEHKIDDLLAAVASAEASGPKVLVHVNEATTETAQNLTGTREAQSGSK